MTTFDIEKKNPACSCNLEDADFNSRRITNCCRDIPLLQF